MRRFLLSLVAWTGSLVLLAWVLRSVSLHEVLQLLRALRPGQLVPLILANLAIVLLLPGRWWLLLRAQGYRLPYLVLARYRLAAFGLSYVTPGPQFGGEPLQVLLVERNHGVPRPAALAAVSLDRVLELLVNFTFLGLGVLLLVTQGLLSGPAGNRLVLASLFLLALPLLYLALLWRGRRPLSSLLASVRWPFGRPPARWRRSALHLAATVSAAEAEAATLCRRVPGVLLPAVLASLLAWLALIGEFWLMLAVLGVTLNPVPLVVVLTATRLGLLMPVPGGLGSLEAALLLGLESQGLPLAAGLGAGILIRSRDTLLAAAGLWSSGLLFRRRRTVT